MADDNELDAWRKLRDLLDEAYEQVRKKSIPQFPYDRKTNAIRLPRHIEHELRDLVASGRKVEAVQRVTDLTGARLRLSKAYVDSLNRKR